MRAAIGVAKGQGARLFELRSATSLCRLADASQRAGLLGELLEPLCNSFNEGADMQDLQQARALLAGARACGVGC